MFNNIILKINISKYSPAYVPAEEKIVALYL